MAVINAPLVLSRASSAAFINSTNGALIEVVNNAPRFDDGLGLLIEGQRTNGIRNPRAEGSIAGTPGTWPTHWAPNGVNGSVIGTGIESGIPYFEHRFNSASAATFSGILDTTVAASASQVWTGSYFIKLVAGTLSNVSFTQMAIVFFDGAGGTGTTLANNVVNFTPTNSAFSTQRWLGTFTAPAGTQSVQLRFRYVTSGTHDFTLRIGSPQLEVASFASSPILPPVGTPAAATRLADAVSAPLSSLGIGGNGACTVVGTFVLPQAAITDAQFLLQVDDASDSNRFFVRNLPGGLTIGGGSQIAAVPGPETSAPSITLNASFKIAASISGGRLAFSLNGGAVNAAIGGPTGGMSMLRFGNSVGGSRSPYGYAQVTSILPYPVSDAVLQQLSAL